MLEVVAEARYPRSMGGRRFRLGPFHILSSRLPLLVESRRQKPRLGTCYLAAHIYIYIHIYYSFVYLFTYIHTYIHTHTFSAAGSRVWWSPPDRTQVGNLLSCCIHLYIHIHLSIHLHVYIHTHIYVHTHTYVYVHIDLFIQIYIYIYMCPCVPVLYSRFLF